MELDIKKYLKKFEQLMPRETKVRNAVIEAVQDVLKISLERSKIAISGSSVYITGSSALRSEIGMKQAKILARIKEISPEIGITRIQ